MHDNTMQAHIFSKQRYSQSENSEKTYLINYAVELDGEAITLSEWTALNGGTVASEANTTKTTQAKLSGSPGTYSFVNKVTTASGVYERNILLTVLRNDSDIASLYA